ncbi:hypothetical protein J2S09_003104 [Bacillus fengqiuensis]|nr:hypothetical protein [Bacillus fengqiuensis]
MRVCELCGIEEEVEMDEHEQMPIRMLHICESCQNDRHFNSFENEM